MKNKFGFTLVELLIVIAILGIMAALVFPKLSPQTERARAAEAISMLSAIRQGEEGFSLENDGKYQNLPPTGGDSFWIAIGLKNANGLPNSFFSYTVTDSNIGGCVGFVALATRNTVSGGNGTDTIGIDSNGTYCGSHPNVPRAPRSADCGCPV